MIWQVWVVILFIAAFGAIGGLAHKLTSSPEDKTRFLNYIIVGAVASLAVFFIFSVEDVLKLIALAIVAGYGGRSILDALEYKVKAALATSETAKAKEEGQKAVNAGRNAVEIGKKLAQETMELLNKPNRENLSEVAKLEIMRANNSNLLQEANEAWKKLTAQLDLSEGYFKKK
jgi:hypothetical protein